MGKLQWGIIGTGGISHAIAKALPESKTGKLAAVASRDKAKAEKWGLGYGLLPARCYGSYQELLADPQIDAIYISLPNHLHAEWTIRCAEAGKHILCEKPFATNLGEAMAAIEAARRHDVFLLEAFMYRCHPQTAKLVQLLRRNVIGDVRVIQANFSYNMGQQLANIRLQNEAAGGAIMDVGCYCASMVRLVAGAATGTDVAEPLELAGSAHIGAKSRVDEYATAALKFPGDILATLTCGSQVNTDWTLHIWGSAGSIAVPNPWFPGAKPADARILVTRTGKPVQTITAPGRRGLYAFEIDLLAKHLKDRQAPAPAMTWADSLGNIRTLDRWRQSVRLVFDREPADAPALQLPFSGQPLRVRPEVPMTYGRIAGVDKPVSRLVMGSMIISSDRPPFNNALLDHYFEAGGNAIDTAYVYGGGGRAEKGVGQWVKARGLRKQVVVIAKGAATIEATPEIVTRELLESLDRLGMEYADLYLMHRDNVNVPVGEFVDCLNQHQRAGRIRAFGGSNWSIARFEAGNDYAKQHGLTGFAASSPNFALAHWNEPMWGDCVTASDAVSRQWYAKTQFPLLAWSSQASGFFTGRYSAKDRTNPAAADVVRVWFNDENFERLRRAKELARKKRCTATQIALAYVLAQPLNLFALIGPQTIEETRSSLPALGVKLTPAELAWLDLQSE